MRSRQGLLRAAAGILALSVFTALILSWLFDRMATNAANRWLSAAFTVPASVKKIKLRLPSGDVEVSGLKIGNPSGFANREFLTLRKARMDIDFSFLWKDEIVAESVLAEGMIVRLERTERRQNAKEIFAPAPGKASRDGEGKMFRIKRLVLADTLLAYPVVGGQQVAAVERMEIEDPLGREKSFPLRGAIARVAARSIRAGGKAAEGDLAGFFPAARESTGKSTRSRKPAAGKAK